MANTVKVFGHKIESLNIYDLASTTVTLSAYIKASALTSVTWTAYYPTATDNYTSRTQIATGTFTINTTSTQYNANISLPSSAVNGVQIEFTTGSLTSGTITYTGVQLEKGSTATSFDYRPYSAELAMCQRYFAKSYNIDVIAGTSTGVGCLSLRQWDSTAARSGIPFLMRYPVSMRATPTLTIYSINGNSGNISESGASDTNTTNRAISSLEGQGMNGCSGASLSAGVAALQYYNWHYAATAEL